MFSKPLVVLMTATLNPGPYADVVKRGDPRLRAEDYARALQFWAAFPDFRIKGIVFCENSGGDPERSLRPMLAGSPPHREIEWLEFKGNTRPKGMHYGYSELGALDYALTHSQLLAETSVFLKVTGRLTFPHISELLNTFDDDVRFAADCRRSYRSETGPPIRARTELMLFEKSFYIDHLYGRREEMLGCSHIEEFIALKMLPLKNHRDVVLRFKTECPPAGVAAHSGVQYQTGRHLLKSKLRQVLRRIAPRFWL
jgi:hypothetical protein